MNNQFHIVFVGIASAKFTKLTLYAQVELGCRVSYVVMSGRDADLLAAEGVSKDDIYRIDGRSAGRDLPVAAYAYLAALDQISEPTVHNAIASDPFIRYVRYEDARAYAASLATRLRDLYVKLQPSVVLTGHDRLQVALSCAVARERGVPWFSLTFSVIPTGLVGLSPTVVPTEMVDLGTTTADDACRDALDRLTDFESRSLRAPAYVSAHSIRLALGRVGLHVRTASTLLGARLTGASDGYNQLSPLRMARQYVRKRFNLLTLPRSTFLTEPPSEPYVLFGLHMQPESSVDVYAPFYSNQRDVIEKVSRALPPTHRFLVKLHISDADNYSRRQLRALRALPGVSLVSPTASSRSFLEQSAAVISIAGTMGLEGALLGKPVIAFGKTYYGRFPTVARVGDIDALPALMRRQLAIARPARADVLAAYADYLRHYTKVGRWDRGPQLDDWTVPLASDDEKAGFARLVRAVEAYVRARAAAYNERTAS